MEIIEKKLAEIRPYERNPRKNDGAVDAVAASIREFGFKVPIVIDQDGVIVCGHTRYKAAKKLKMKAVPCVVADDLTQEQAKAFRLADNKVGEIADWDMDALMAELAGMDVDMQQFGFEVVEDLLNEENKQIQPAQQKETRPFKKCFWLVEVDISDTETIAKIEQIVQQIKELGVYVDHTATY